MSTTININRQQQATFRRRITHHHPTTIPRRHHNNNNHHHINTLIRAPRMMTTRREVAAAAVVAVVVITARTNGRQARLQLNRRIDTQTRSSTRPSLTTRSCPLFVIRPRSSSRITTPIAGDELHHQILVKYFKINTRLIEY